MLLARARTPAPGRKGTARPRAYHLPRPVSAPTHRSKVAGKAASDDALSDDAAPARVAEDPAQFSFAAQTVQQWTRFFAVLGTVSAVLVRFSAPPSMWQAGFCSLHRILQRRDMITRHQFALLQPAWVPPLSTLSLERAPLMCGKPLLYNVGESGSFAKLYFWCYGTSCSNGGAHADSVTQ